MTSQHDLASIARWRGAGVHRILAPPRAGAVGMNVNIWDVSDIIQALVRTQKTSP